MDKSKLLCFDLSPACKNNVFDVYINSEPVIIDNKLTWHQHIENIKNKINKGLGILKKIVSLFTGRYTCQPILSSFKTVY